MEIQINIQELYLQYVAWECSTLHIIDLKDSAV